MYDIDYNQRGRLKVHTRKFLLYPDYWIESNNQINIPLIWQYVKFNSINLSSVPSRKGIYCFVVQPNVLNFFKTRYLFYLGKTDRALRVRFKEYLDDQAGKGKPRPKVKEMLDLYKEYLYFYYAEIANNQNVKICEDKLLNTFVPHINTFIPTAKIKTELRYIYE